MRASCSICTENFTFEKEISATPCGHTFHEDCLSTWFKESRTCPQCRKNVKVANVIHKLFFSAEDEHEVSEDVGKLKNEIDNLRLSLRHKDKEISDCKKEKDKQLEKINGLRETNESLQLLFQQEQSKTDTLKKELSCLRKAEKEAERNRELAEKLQQKLVFLKNIEDIVNGMMLDIEFKANNSSKRDLATWCVVQEKELRRKKSDSRKYEEQLLLSKKSNEEQAKKLEILSERLHLSEEDVKNLEKQNKTLKDKLDVMQKSASMDMFINESPAPKRLRASCDEIGKIIDLDGTCEDLFSSPFSTITPNTKMKNSCKEYGTKFVKITTAAKSNSKTKSSVDDTTNLPHNIPGLENFNILKKLGTTSSIMNQKSAIKKGYNGLGGHEKYVQSTRMTMPKKSAVKKSTSGKAVYQKTSLFANNPPLPSLQNL